MHINTSMMVHEHQSSRVCPDMETGSLKVCPELETRIPTTIWPLGVKLSLRVSSFPCPLCGSVQVVVASWPSYARSAI